MLGAAMSNDETVRFPTKLDPAAIFARLLAVREAAQAAGLTEIAGMLKDVETLPPPKIGMAVIGAMGRVAGKDEHQAISKQLQIIAMNLKNLK